MVTVCVLACLNTESLQDFKIAVKTSDNLPPLRNPDILLGENDLTSLSYLHEPAGSVTCSTRYSIDIHVWMHLVRCCCCNIHCQ